MYGARRSRARASSGKATTQCRHEARPAERHHLRTTALPVVAYGFASLAGQILLLRELVAVLRGTELAYGIGLCAWLVWSAAGVWIGGVTASRRRSPPAWLSASVCVLASAVPVALWCVRVVRGLLLRGLAPGEALTVGEMLLVGTAAVAPLCLVSGVAFSVCLQAGSLTLGPRATPTVYGCVALGDLVAGALLSTRVMTEYLQLTVACLCAAVAMALLAAGARSGRAAVAWALPAFGFWFLSFSDPVVRLELAGAQHIVGERLAVVGTLNSVHGNIIATQRGTVSTFFQNGEKLYSASDPAACEEVQYIPLVTGASGYRVLMLGGAVSGEVGEVLKYGPERLDVVEFDPRRLEMARLVLEPETLDALSDPRVRLLTGDGRLMLRRALEAYDLIIVLASAPTTLAANRTYTVEFFREARARLHEGGTVAVAVPGDASYLGEQAAALAGCVYASMSAVFDDVSVLPGGTMYLLGTRGDGRHTLDPAAAAETLRSLNLDNKYLQPSVVRWSERLDKRRMAQMRDRLAEYRGSLNRDFAPVCCQYAISYRAHLTERGVRTGRVERTLDLARSVPVAAFLAIAALVAAGAAVLARRRKGGWFFVLATLAAAAFAGMVGEVLVLLTYQALHGYVYQRVALVLGAALAGTAVGSLVLAPRFLFTRHALAVTAVALAGTVLAVPFAMGATSGRVPLAGDAAAVLLSLAIGTLVGAAYPLACAEGRGDAARRGATAYAADLAGAAAGALVGSIILVPTRGFVATAAVAGIFVCIWVPAVLLCAQRPRAGPAQQ